MGGEVYAVEVGLIGWVLESVVVGLTVDGGFELFFVVGPVEAVEPFETGKLGFVAGAVGVAGAEVDELFVLFEGPLDGVGHHTDVEIFDSVRFELVGLGDDERVSVVDETAMGIDEGVAEDLVS